VPPHIQSCQDADTSTGSSGCNDAIDTENICIFWTAGVDLEAGQEVCSSHRGYLTPDVALLLHGIQLHDWQQQQQGEAAASWLFALDSTAVDVQELLTSPGVTPAQLAPFEGETAVHGFCGVKRALLPSA
jgi:hypothetical protein